MSEYYEYTPTTEQIELLVLGQLKQSAEKRGIPVDVEADRADFRRWLATVEAAAEQRGAIKALREAAEDSGLIDYMYKYFAHPHLHAPPTVRAASSYLHDRADQIEQENTDA